MSWHGGHDPFPAWMAERADPEQPLGPDSPCPFCGENCFGNACLDEPPASPRKDDDR